MKLNMRQVINFISLTHLNHLGHSLVVVHRFYTNHVTIFSHYYGAFHITLKVNTCLRWFCFCWNYCSYITSKTRPIFPVIISQRARFLAKNIIRAKSLFWISLQLHPKLFFFNFGRNLFRNNHKSTSVFLSNASNACPIFIKINISRPIFM